ncbi:MAG: VWA domain-containing protein [Polyangiaceae bacterium]
MRRHGKGFLGSAGLGKTAAVVATGLLVASCGSGEQSTTGDGTGGSGASQTTIGGSGGSGATTGEGGIFNTGGATTGTGTGGLEECAKETQAGTLTPVDLVIMLDQSGSMDGEVGNTTVWKLVTGALTDFVQGSGTEGLAVGLQYFPLADGPCVSCNGCFLPDLQVTDQTTNQCCCSPPTGANCNLPDGSSCPGGGICFQSKCYSGGATATCDSADYSALEVPVADLPGNAQPVITSLAQHTPHGLTPTAPALQGAVDAAIARANAFPDHTVAVVLASDGVPTECAPQVIADIADIAAAAAAATPKIRTYVIGIGDVAALNAIAQAGDGGNAFLVSANGNAGQQFLDAMNKIKGSLLSCEFDIPEPQNGTLDYELVNVQFTPEGGAPEVIPQVKTAGDCGSSPGWYYDNPAAPQKILLCDKSCEAVKATAKASIEIVLGCTTIVK